MKNAMYSFRRKLLIVDNSRPTWIIESERLKVEGVHGHEIVVGGPVEVEFECSNLALSGNEPITIAFKHDGSLYSIEKCMKHDHYNRRRHIFTGLFCEPWTLDPSMKVNPGIEPETLAAGVRRRSENTTQRNRV